MGYWSAYALLNSIRVCECRGECVGIRSRGGSRGAREKRRKETQQNEGAGRSQDGPAARRLDQSVVSFFLSVGPVSSVRLAGRVVVALVGVSAEAVALRLDERGVEQTRTAQTVEVRERGRPDREAFV